MLKRFFNNRNNNGTISKYIEGNYQVDPSKEALIITGIYGFFGMLWIVLSDRVLYMLISDIALYRQIQTYKGWLYVVVTMILIYSLVRTRSGLFQRALSKTRDAYQDLEATYEELVATDDELTHQKEFTENMIKDAPVIIAIWDNEGRIITLNPYGQKLLGYSESEIKKCAWVDLLSNSNISLMKSTLKRIQIERQVKNLESKLMTKDKKEVIILWNSSIVNTRGTSSEIVSVGTDITSRKRLEEKLKEMAYYDMLTKLPNRSMLEAEAHKLIEEQTPFALAYLDIDNFKHINDTLGHATGDRFLKYIANRMRQLVPTPHLIGRVSGDEFIVIYKEYMSQDEIQKELMTILEGLGKTWKYQHHEFFISFSIGVSLYPDNGLNQTILFQNADIAMYKAKKTGKGRCIFYTDDILIESQQDIQMVNALQFAIENEVLQLFYQPQLELASRKIIGMEALIRWKDPIRGYVSPVEFIPLAEDTGQIYAIEKWVVKTMLSQKKKFEEDGYRDVNMSFNLSSKTLTSDINFYEIECLLTSFDLNYSQVTIEITETAIISDIESVIERLYRLKKIGVKLALDDFGTGYSSLTHLKNLPIDIVKLDRSFVKSIEENSKDAKIIKSILFLAKDLNYEVVAEGIETKEQLAFLHKYNCKIGQGFLFSEPVPIEIMKEKLDQNSIIV